MDCFVEYESWVTAMYWQIMISNSNYNNDNDMRHKARDCLGGGLFLTDNDA